MAGRPRDEALRAAQRERILAAAEQLLVSHGVERSRLRDVAEAAGVSVGTVQHWFATRDHLIEDLFEWSGERRLRQWTEAVPATGTPWQRFTALLDATLPEPALWRSRIWIEFCAMARDDALRARLDRFYDAWRPPLRAAIEAGVASGDFRPAMATDDIVDVIVMLVDGATVGISLTAPGIDPERVRHLLLATARTALRPTVWQDGPAESAGHRAAFGGVPAPASPASPAAPATAAAATRTTARATSAATPTTATPIAAGTRGSRA